MTSNDLGDSPRSLEALPPTQPAAWTRLLQLPRLWGQGQGQRRPAWFPPRLSRRPPTWALSAPIIVQICSAHRPSSL